MSHTNSSTYGELTLEPMETGEEEGVFADFSSRDRRPPDHATTDATTHAAGAGQVNQIESAGLEHSATGSALKKPTGKANFFTDDRRLPDRRLADRRTLVRLTGDRRSGSERRTAISPWNQGSPA